MKLSCQLNFWWWVAAVFGLDTIWQHTWGSPPPAPPPRWGYQTFDWPGGTETGFCTFYPGHPPAGGTNVIAPGCKLDEILEKARDLAGYELCGTVGDTIILRRREPAEVPADVELSYFGVAAEPLR